MSNVRTSKHIASVAAKLMKHPDKKVRKVAAAALVNRKPKS